MPNWKELLKKAHHLVLESDDAIAHGRQDDAITLIREREKAVNELVRALRPDLFVRKREDVVS